MAGEIEIGGYGPGALGRIVELHADYYARHWGFGPYFEAKVAGDLADFLSRGESGGESADDRLWCARAAGRLVGAIAIDGANAARAGKWGQTLISAAAPPDPGETGAHLRWFIVEEALQGAGLGARLLDGALAFCRARGFASVYLWTFAGLDAARRLYEARGFRLAEEAPAETWGTRVVEQRFMLRLG
jgi:GNAT superfamily N-acetyltransferase